MAESSPVVQRAFKQNAQYCRLLRRAERLSNSGPEMCSSPTSTASSVPSVQSERSRSVDGPWVVIWLGGIYFMILLMVVVGGTTRLTGSGLSMVEWHPLMGLLPPSSDAEWQAAFQKYQRFPQYQQVNQWMDLGAFQKIFFWEYIHRLLGRLLGLVVVIPWMILIIRRKLSSQTSRRVAVALFLGASQGLLGWYMVKSGLAVVPEVSHYRLAAHLLLALACSQWILWMLLDIVSSSRAINQNSVTPRLTPTGLPCDAFQQLSVCLSRASLKGSSAARLTSCGEAATGSFGVRRRRLSQRATDRKEPDHGSKKSRWLASSLLILIELQIIYGAFVAGKRAGHLSSTFPDMNGRYLPTHFFTRPSLISNLLENPLSLHYLHRVLGLAVLMASLTAGLWWWRRSNNTVERGLGLGLALAATVQFSLGAATVLLSVPLATAVAHQAGAFLLLGICTAWVHQAFKQKRPG